jgi:hypothetical protein
MCVLTFRAVDFGQAMLGLPSKIVRLLASHIIRLPSPNAIFLPRAAAPFARPVAIN